jgi:HEPN domain-containing protein/predicted nucleotidyltransferase
VTETEVERVIPQLAERIVREVDPLKIYLFGSHGRGDARDHSDVDLLVVVADADGDGVAARLRRALRDVRIAKDVFAVATDFVARTGDSVGSFVYPVLREGRIIYGVDDRDANTWLRYAAEDLEAAERMVAGQGWAPRIACFHAQQAAEKALKAVLAASGIPLQFTRDLELLRDIVPGDSRVHRLDVDLASLSRWAVVPRYPGGIPEADPEDARVALAMAQAVVDAARGDVA